MVNFLGEMDEKKLFFWALIYIQYNRSQVITKNKHEINKLITPLYNRCYI